MKRLLSIRVLLPAVTLLTTLALVSIFAIYAKYAVDRREEVRRIPLIVDVSYDLVASIQDFRLERGAVNRVLALLEQQHGMKLDLADTSFFLARDTVVPSKLPGMAIWREKLFVRMARNAVRATAFFRLPPERVVELGVQVEI